MTAPMIVAAVFSVKSLCLSIKVIEEEGVKTTYCMTTDLPLTLRREGGQTVDRFEYDDDGSPTGISVQFKDKSFKVAATRRKVEVPGMPRLERIYGTNGELQRVTANGRAVLEYRRDTEGHVNGVNVASELDLSTARNADGAIHQVLRDRSGAVLYETTVAAAYGNRPPPTFRLNLLGDARSYEVQSNATESMFLLIDSQNTPHYYDVLFGPDRVLFDDAARPVLYDIDLLGELDEGPSSATVFSRLL